MPKTPIHGFRIPADLYAAAVAKAESEGRTVSDVVREALINYVASSV
ncbi:ribbon-helix-helix protein, CopG family [Herbiconiux ginsengi]